MSSQERDPHPDSQPQENHDRRSDIEQAMDVTNRNIGKADERAIAAR